jgi:hypothetical protein
MSSVSFTPRADGADQPVKQFADLLEAFPRVWFGVPVDLDLADVVLALYDHIGGQLIDKLGCKVVDDQIFVRWVA